VRAGDSAAVAHGNMYSQSYTTILEQTVKWAFDAVGIEFIARNHAMADFGSGTELAMCTESLYGTNIDVLSWDFSRVDRLSDYRRNLWGNRAAVHLSRLILMVMDSSERDHWSYF